VTRNRLYAGATAGEGVSRPVAKPYGSVEVLSSGAKGVPGAFGGKLPGTLPREPRQARKGATVPWTLGARRVAGLRSYTGTWNGF